ncbi:DRMBL-domain-containing protein [Sistotremastrum niveocremeum HHB9708]|uniref:DRMBL-domain-containing protein n=1 Tax=Sistotremastrum niveocremeum HHB9708 TaxID=1314777 RepID=A0A164RND3_9AGAM|nr:DRMBL-domain-containing protein [Sistotremastrum niveocremeum HHB9708]
MSGHGENEAWKEAAEAEDRNFRPTKGQPRRKAPFYKVMPGMPIAVDAFRYGKIPGVTSYWLSHAHSDHYTNLSSNWKNGPIYCSITTANLIIHMLDVDPKWVHPLPNNVKTLVPDSGGVSVTVIEANHCPGSSLFLFEGPQTTNAGDSNFRSPFVGSKRTFRYLHCGDFRACPQHVLHPSIKGKHLDQIYLDTTYLNPKYCFPPQPLVIDACAELAVKIVNGENVEACQVGLGSEGVKPQGSITDWAKVVKEEGAENVKMEEGKERVLVVIGTYSIGKERIVKAVAKALNSKVYCDARKAKLLRCQNDPELHALLTSDPYEATIHVVPLQCINSDRFGSYLEQYGRVFKKAVGFRPTGWTYSPPAGTDMMPSIPFVISRDQKRTFTWSSLKPMRNSTPTAMLYGIPYSEHSSFFELTCFALSLSWGKMIATVNVGSATSRGKMMKWFERWESERKKVVRDASYMKRGDDKDSVIAYRRVDYW